MSITLTTRSTAMLGDIWMVLNDPKKLAKLMVIQGVSQRQLARAAGWKAHSYLGKLLRGDVKTLETEPALRIANFLKVGVDDLFLLRSDANSVRSGQNKKILSSRDVSKNSSKVSA